MRNYILDWIIKIDRRFNKESKLKIVEKLMERINELKRKIFIENWNRIKLTSLGELKIWKVKN